MADTTQEDRADEIFDVDDPIVIDLDDLTVAEQAEVEELSGLPFSSLLDSNTPNRKMLQALLFVSARKDYDDVTFEMAGLAKPGGYGWLMEDEQGKNRIPLLALQSGSPLTWALLAHTSDSAINDDETLHGASSGDASSPESENLTSSQTG